MVVGTDQDGRMFWTKINEDFVRRGGNQSRAYTSLKTRFSRTLQHDVNKYIGHLQGAIREYHSGWVMTDYVAKPVDDFECVEGMFYIMCDSSCVVSCALHPVGVLYRVSTRRVLYRQLSTSFFVSSTRNAKV